MMKGLPIVIVGALAALQIVPSAMAQQSPTAKAQMQMLRNVLSNQTTQAEVSPALATDRTATIRFNIRIHRKTAFDMPLRCLAQITHQPTGSFFAETSSVRANFTGGTGQCVVPIRFHWPTADDAQPVRMAFTVGFDSRVTDISAAEAAKPLRSIQVNPPSIPLPVQNSVVTFNFDVDM